MRFLRVIYVMGIAALIIALVIAGVEAFYPDSSYPGGAIYARNVFLVVLPLGVVFTVVGTFIQRRLGIFGAGLILGGIGTMVYAVTPYRVDSILRFVGIAVALAVLIFVGYKVFFSSRRS
jgi:hypothetical protein